MPRKFTKKLPNTVPAPKAPKATKANKKSTATQKKKASKKKYKSNSIEENIENAFSDASRIQVLETRNEQLEKTIDNFNKEDKPYGHNKSTDYLLFGRTKSQYDELMTIARHLKATYKNPTKAIEKIENYPIKTRDKFIILLELTSELTSK